ncbi:hypothetical protein [Hydrogenimonas sp.]
MQIKILILLSIAFIIIGCQRNNITYKEVSKSELRKLLKTNFDTDEEKCYWYYGKNSKNHFFDLHCVKRKRSPDSFLIIKKRIKIKRRAIEVDAHDLTPLVAESPNVPLSEMTIKW